MPRPKPDRKPDHIKNGNLSKTERAKIADMAHTGDSELVAKRLGRSPKQVRNIMDKITGVKHEEKMTLEEELVMRPEWVRFKKQFSVEEQSEFKHQYVAIMTQMKGNVIPTEELHVFQVISLNIQLDRNMVQQKRAHDAMLLTDERIEALRLDPNNMDVEKLEYWENVHESAKKSLKELADAFKIYSDKQDKMLNALKATRDQRVKVSEGNDKSILGLVKMLAMEDQRKVLGEEAEIMKIASQKEKERLSRPHRFGDGTIDQIIYSSETVGLYDQADEEWEGVEEGTTSQLLGTEVPGVAGTGEEA